MLYLAILLIIVGVVLLIMNKITPKRKDASKKQSYISFGVICLIIGVFWLVGTIIKMSL
ncbi:hypothetical protein MHZ36_01375 [Staphylococcus sp. ACRSN]|uniref:hypothetical protein n=1 Tax=Staphylococcus sp. ACRSN TaxID=2918214 RepID=UPI001EF30640|nr:hypothetical protein [Staphylococcus sp. ACRSN]MCG7337929.1 hypothetical protein [Staphylococcus sp. ACRSN]